MHERTRVGEIRQSRLLLVLTEHRSTSILCVSPGLCGCAFHRWLQSVPFCSLCNESFLEVYLFLSFRCCKQHCVEHSGTDVHVRSPFQRGHSVSGFPDGRMGDADLVGLVFHRKLQQFLPHCTKATRNKRTPLPGAVLGESGVGSGDALSSSLYQPPCAFHAGWVGSL